VTYLKQVIQKATGQYVLDAYSTSAQRVKEEKELANSSTNVEGVERLFKTIKLCTNISISLAPYMTSVDFSVSVLQSCTKTKPNIKIPAKHI